MLPADPLQVGVSEGSIAPQDMFNPILYKAVSNESFSTLEARLAGLKWDNTSAINGQSIIKSDDFTNIADDFNVYYALLSNRDGFKTAHPQEGLTLRGLVPLVFEQYYNYGVNINGYNDTQAELSYSDIEPTSTTDSTLRVTTSPVRSMRGRAHPMPRFNTTYVTGALGNQTELNNDKSCRNGMSDGSPFNTQTQMPDILPVYTAAIVMPPCKLNRLFYRMVVRTTLEFTEVRPIQEVISFAQMSSVYAPIVYQSDYTVQSASMTAKLGMVDAAEASIEKIMEGA